jgi:hypothetical protein
MPLGVTQASQAATSGNGLIVLSANNSLYFKNGNSYTAVVVPGAGSALNAANGMESTILEMSSVTTTTRTVAG